MVYCIYELCPIYKNSLSAEDERMFVLAAQTMVHTKI